MPTVPELYMSVDFEDEHHDICLMCGGDNTHHRSRDDKECPVPIVEARVDNLEFELHHQLH